ncbi:hypothetical protein L596_017705 [Steinernema carpocapsae]|uniref:Uncharacterized protein n=1 Tax=Steinernema carpocapsae TaxID=34508 RepID=A0A4U5N2F5_STECR|nr:hypothetical protein L596_017705 [Steinernema carpocapsae]
MLSPAAACVRRNLATHDSGRGVPQIAAAQRSKATPPQNAASRRTIAAARRSEATPPHDAAARRIIRGQRFKRFLIANSGITWELLAAFRKVPLMCLAFLGYHGDADCYSVLLNPNLSCLFLHK